jgi:hypothetical protein
MVARYRNLSLIVKGVLGCIGDERSCGGSARFSVGVAGLLAA